MIKNIHPISGREELLAKQSRSTASPSSREARDRAVLSMLATFLPGHRGRHRKALRGRTGNGAAGSPPVPPQGKGCGRQPLDTAAFLYLLYFIFFFIFSLSPKRYERNSAEDDAGPRELQPTPLPP